MPRVNLHRRLTLLEKHVTSELIVLLMPDGRIETLPGHGDRAIDLLAGVFRADRTPDLELVAQSISSTEPGGAHLIDLARAILNSPAEDAP